MHVWIGSGPSNQPLSLQLEWPSGSSIVVTSSYLLTSGDQALLNLIECMRVHYLKAL
jgi:hypothetical protein